MTKNEWIVWDLTKDAMCCTRCKAEYKFNMPMPINMFIAASKAFARDHRTCKKPQDIENRKV